MVRAYALRGPGEIILYTVLMLFGTIYVLQRVRNHTSSDFARHNCAKRSTPLVIIANIGR